MSKQKNRGEGNPKAAKEYRKGLKKQLAAGEMPRLAQEAKEALSGPVEGSKLRRAEGRAKRGEIAEE